MGMTAHIVFPALDPDRPAFAETLSASYDGADRILSRVSSLGDASKAHVGAYTYGSDTERPHAASTAGALTMNYDAVGKLAEDYPACGAGYDQMVLDGIGLDKDATLSYIRSNKPTYPQLEKWVLDQKGGKLDDDKVEALNKSIAGYNHADETRKEILEASGLEDDGSILDAVNLNNLDDWFCFHQQEIA